MGKKIVAGSALASLVLAGGIAATVSAQTAATETGLTEEQVIAIALMEVPGEVLEIELEREDGMQVYEIEILSAEGVETEIEIAAATGDILEIEDEDCDKTRDK
ncbi:MAG: PepSY domain-containing protein [Paracoccaceae bacterium]|nr:PepSY domain-containing protein [Paracoccaceae bacterium]